MTSLRHRLGKELVCIEYPGVVRNPDRMMASLGGAAELSTVSVTCIFQGGDLVGNSPLFLWNFGDRYILKNEILANTIEFSGICFSILSGHLVHLASSFADLTFYSSFSRKRKTKRRRKNVVLGRAAGIGHRRMDLAAAMGVALHRPRLPTTPPCQNLNWSPNELPCWRSWTNK